MDSETPDSLANRAPDYVVTAAKAALGAVPFAGSLLAELAGSIIPNQRIVRIVAFAKELESRLSDADRRFVRTQLTNENFTDLMEESLRQVAKSVTQERRVRIAALIANSLTPKDVSYIESKQLLRILGEVNDVELIRLAWHLFEAFGDGTQYWEQHRGILEPVAPTFGAPQPELDRSTLQNSFDEHLAQVRNYGITALGRLLLKQAGVEVDEERANLRMEPTAPN